MKHAATLVAAAFALAASTAHAQDDSAADQARAKAQELNKQGVDALGKKDYAGALDAFQQAYAAFPSPKVLLNIAASLKSLGRNAESANTYQKWLDDPGADSSRRSDVNKVLGQLDPNLGIVSITTEPADAEVQVDGWAPGWIPPGADTPWLPAGQVSKWRVTPGPFIVRARKTGYVQGQQTGSVNAAAKASVTVTLEEEKKPDPVVEHEEPEHTEVATTHEEHVEQPVEVPGPTTKAVRFGAVVDVAIDGSKFKGAAVSPGIAVRLSDRFDLFGKALLASTKGMFIGASVALTKGKIRPTIGAGVPIFFADGARFGVRGDAGVSVELGRFSIVGELGAEYFLNAEMNRPAFVFVPVLGIHGWL